MNKVSIPDRTLKEEIAKSFGRSVPYYEEEAKLQKDIADRLIASLEPWKAIIPPGPILEIGCGTGFVTKGLIDLYPNRAKEITDISSSMVEFCKTKFKGAANTDFYTLDAESIDPESSDYSLTVSGFAAQWFNDPALTLGRILEATKPGGLMLVSFPGSESFPEWKEKCRDLGIPFTGNQLPDTEEVAIKLSVGPAQIDFYEDTVTQKFSGAADFFRHLKLIGAGTKQNDRSLSPKELKMLIRHWNESTEGEISVNYHVVFMAVKRDHTA
ncbi:MAG: methyltransferase domain-containing protein [Balneolaceae bacterium]|nr:methyltransferase domain-containing protein [Balneolaceae bacterium]